MTNETKEYKLPERKVTTHEYCDAYKNHGVNHNYCQREIDNDNKSLGFNSCLDQVTPIFNGMKLRVAELESQLAELKGKK